MPCSSWQGQKLPGQGQTARAATTPEDVALTEDSDCYGRDCCSHGQLRKKGKKSPLLVPERHHSSREWQEEGGEVKLNHEEHSVCCALGSHKDGGQLNGVVLRRSRNGTHLQVLVIHQGQREGRLQPISSSLPY